MRAGVYDWCCNRQLRLSRFFEVPARSRVIGRGRDASFLCWAGGNPELELGAPGGPSWLYLASSSTIDTWG